MCCFVSKRTVCGCFAVDDNPRAVVGCTTVKMKIKYHQAYVHCTLFCILWRSVNLYSNFLEDIVAISITWSSTLTHTSNWQLLYLIYTVNEWYRDLNMSLKHWYWLCKTHNLCKMLYSIHYWSITCIRLGDGGGCLHTCGQHRTLKTEYKPDKALKRWIVM